MDSYIQQQEEYNLEIQQFLALLFISRASFNVNSEMF